MQANYVTLRVVRAFQAPHLEPLHSVLLQLHPDLLSHLRHSLQPNV